MPNDRRARAGQNGFCCPGPGVDNARVVARHHDRGGVEVWRSARVDEGGRLTPAGRHAADSYSLVARWGTLSLARGPCVRRDPLRGRAEHRNRQASRPNPRCLEVAGTPGVVQHWEGAGYRAASRYAVVPLLARLRYAARNTAREPLLPAMTARTSVRHTPFPRGPRPFAPKGGEPISDSATSSHAPAASLLKQQHPRSRSPRYPPRSKARSG